MHRTSGGKPDRTRQYISLLAVTVTLASMISVAAVAQTRPPDIKAEERRDPAAGKVVIINRKKRKNPAPDPYAPKPSSSNEKPQTKSNNAGQASAPAKPLIRRHNAVQRQRPSEQPPLPEINTEQRAATARLRSLPQPGYANSERHSETTSQRRPAIEPRPAPRSTAQQRRYSERRQFRRRPWRQCRILARRCQAGYDGSCYVWQRRCT